MNADQFDRFLAAMQRSGNKRKLPEFTSGDPLQWLEWRVTYNNIQQLNNWNDNDVCVAQIKAAMGGYAAVAVQGLHHDEPGPLLDLYEAKFVTAAGSVQARQMFTAAKQQHNESITAWHTRVRTLYRRADAAANLETTKELIDRFIFGLENTVVMEKVLDAQPADMTVALAQATAKAATVACMAEHSGKKPPPGVHAMGATSEGPDGAKGAGPSYAERKQKMKCYKCHEPGHFKRDCPKKGAGSGGGGNRNKGGQKKGNQPMQGRKISAINALVDLLQQAEVGEEETGGAAAHATAGQEN